MTSLRTLALACGLALLSATALAHGYKAGSLEIGHPWARATPKAAPVGAGFLTITNTGTTPDRLTAVAAGVSSRVELHEMSMEGGVMKMRALADGIVVPAGGRVELKPGGFHVMFIGLKDAFEAGKTFKGTLQFEKAGPVEVEFAIEDMAAKPMDHSGAHPMGH
jgi:copper(I)-binding protein